MKNNPQTSTIKPFLYLKFVNFVSTEGVKHRIVASELFLTQKEGIAPAKKERGIWIYKKNTEHVLTVTTPPQKNRRGQPPGKKIHNDCEINLQ